MVNDDPVDKLDIGGRQRAIDIKDDDGTFAVENMDGTVGNAGVAGDDEADRILTGAPK